MAKRPSASRPATGLLLDTELEHLFGLLSFLEYEPFCQRSVWQSYISRPLRKDVPSAKKRLFDILAQVMVKNKQEDIDNEIALPPCTIQGALCSLQFPAPTRSSLNERSDLPLKNMQLFGCSPMKKRDKNTMKSWRRLTPI